MRLHLYSGRLTQGCPQLTAATLKGHLSPLSASAGATVQGHAPEGKFRGCEGERAESARAWACRASAAAPPSA